MNTEVAVRQAIRSAERILPGRPAAEGEVDRRWQAIVAVGEFVESRPEEVWGFVVRWGKHASADLRMAVATCLLEHLLEHHFELIFPRVRREALRSVRFAGTFSSCWGFGQAEEAGNARRVRRLKQDIRRRFGGRR